MNPFPTFLSVVFEITTLLTVFLFYKSTPKAMTIIILLLVWLGLQCLIALSGFYTKTDSFPPRFVLATALALLFIIGLFVTAKGRRFVDSLSIKNLTILHTVRILVELVLYGLFLNKAIPEVMTFEGRNFDIIAGLTAPLVYYFGFIKPVLNRKIILFWNIICLGLLLNIVVIAILSAPFTFQKLGFDQPNIAILYFPFIWLPCCVVPIVFLAHLAAIRQLTNQKSQVD